MSTETMLFLIMFFLIVGILPAWPYSKPWGYRPTGILTLLLGVFLVWVIVGGRPLFRSSGVIQDAAQDLKSAGRDVADSVRRTVQ